MCLCVCFLKYILSMPYIKERVDRMDELVRIIFLYLDFLQFFFLLWVKLPNNPWIDNNDNLRYSSDNNVTTVSDYLIILVNCFSDEIRYQPDPISDQN